MKMKSLLCVFMLCSLLFSLNRTAAQDITPFTPPGDGVSYMSYASSNNGFTGLYSVNIITGAQTTIRTPAAIKFNAIGYNVQDNFIYGAYAGTTSGSAASASNQIVKLGANGNHTLLTVSGLPSDTYEAGDVDANGNLYLYSSSASTVYKIDLAAATLSATAISLSGGANLADISVSNDGSKIWGYSAGNGSIVTYTNGTRSTRSTRSSGFSAASMMNFYDSRGNLFFISEVSADVYLANPSEGAMETIVDNTATSVFQGDGAQSRNASVYSNTQPPFSCEANVGYVISQAGEDLYRINTAESNYTLVKDDISGPALNLSPNNMGYNPKDGFLWAYRGGTNQLIRIGSDYSVQYFPISGLSSTGSYDAGMFDLNGVFYLYDAEDPLGVIRRLNIDPASPTYLQFLPDLDITPVGFTTTSGIGDIALNLKDGKLYGVTSNGSLMRIDTANGQMTSLGAITGGGAANTNTAFVSIAFIDPQGNLYFQRSAATNMWKVTNVQDGNVASTLYKSDLTALDGGDGARCLMSSFGDGALEVTFGDISAFISGGNLQVTWQTLKETNNYQFEIEVSKDGKSWTRAGSNISSKADNGNSDSSIQYEQSIPSSGMAVMSASLFLLSMGMMFRKNKWLRGVLLIVSISAFLYGCTKKDSPFSSRLEKLYVRIKQVDKDGAISYSKVVTAIIR